MSMILCHDCGCLCDSDLYPEGFYRLTEDDEAEPSDEYRCVSCNENDW